MTANPTSKVEPWDLVAAGYTRELILVFSKWRGFAVAVDRTGGRQVYIGNYLK